MINQNTHLKKGALVFGVFFLALSFLLLPGCSARPVKVRIGSYNLRMQQLDKGDNAWEVRRARVMTSIRENDFDVFGVQELTDWVQAELLEDIGDTYAAVFFSPYSQDGVGDKAQGILYRKDRFKLLEYHYFWPADDPFVMTKNDHHVNNPAKSYIRGGICALFKDKRSGKKFFFINTHSALNHEEHAKYAHVYVDMEKKFNPKGLPSFFVGDLNARPNHPSHEVFRAWWSDSAENLEPRPVTFNGFKTDPSLWGNYSQIDFIYYRNIDAPEQFTCNQKMYDGLCASDHFPIWADFVIKK